MPDAHILYRQVSELLFSSDHGAAVVGDDEGNPEPPPATPASQRDTRPSARGGRTPGRSAGCRLSGDEMR